MIYSNEMSLSVKLFIYSWILSFLSVCSFYIYLRSTAEEIATNIKIRKTGDIVARSRKFQSDKLIRIRVNFYKAF